MTFHFSTLQHLVLNPSSDLPPKERSNPLLERIASMLRAEESNVGPADIAVLLRQALLACQDSSDVRILRVPSGPPWPDAAEWRLFGCEARTAAIGFYFVTPVVAYPRWLEDHVDALLAATRADQRRTDRRVVSDPAIKYLFGHDYYSSPGQRVAVRATFLLPPAATALILLPTGAGKSLIFHSTALLGLSESSLTVVVVPTVALARDQELRFREILNSRGADIKGAGGAHRAFSYHSGLSDEDKRALRSSIADGTLPILFASPESLLNSLRPSLFLAAQRGKLRYFVVDEVHMVAQWGEQFRPEFHMLSGLRTALLAACPPSAKFKTLLLTATLTSDSYQTIRALFSDSDFRVIAELALRPEPQHVIETARDEHRREERVEEAIRFAPRPMILYTSLRKDAVRWAQRFRSLGFRRVRLVRGGDLTTGPGETTLREWKNREIDVIVATSAFGLGVDQNEVRTIIHACLPESIDRFYQEVGRSGRDGCASISFLVTSPSDEKTAMKLSRKQRISIERGFERWMEMWTRRKLIADSVFTVSLDDTPIDINFTGVQNASWNLRTLVLMRAANLLEFVPHLPTELFRYENEDDESFDARRVQSLKQAFREVAIRVLDPGHSDRQTWDHHVASARHSLREVEKRSIAWTKELLALRRPIQALLREVYSLSELDLRPPPVAIQSGLSLNPPNPSWIHPEVWVMPPLETSISALLRSSLSASHDGSGRFWISYELPSGDSLKMRESARTLTDVLKFAVDGGFLELSLPDWIGSPENWSMLLRQASTRFLLRSEPAGSQEAGLRIPRVTVLGGGEKDQAFLSSAMMIDSPAHLILFPVNLRDPRRLDRRISDVVPHISIHNLLSRLQA